MAALVYAVADVDGNYAGPSFAAATAAAAADAVEALKHNRLCGSPHCCQRHRKYCEIRNQQNLLLVLVAVVPVALVHSTD